MNNLRFSLQAILLEFYTLLAIAMIANIIYDFLVSQKNEVLLEIVFLVIFIICLISGIFNVFYYSKIDNLLILTFMFYFLLPISLPLLIVEIKNKDKINQKNFFVINENFVKWFIVVTTILQTIELFLLIGLMLNFYSQIHKN